MIYFTRFVQSNSIRMLSLFYHKLIERIEEHERKKYLMVGDYMLDKALKKVKEINTEKFDNTKVLIDTDDKLQDYIT